MAFASCGCGGDDPSASSGSDDDNAAIDDAASDDASDDDSFDLDVPDVLIAGPSVLPFRIGRYHERIGSGAGMEGSRRAVRRQGHDGPESARRSLGEAAVGTARNGCVASGR